jgi:hypothetical protein
MTSEPHLYDRSIAEDRIRRLHDSSFRISIAATGAGLGIQTELWDVAGASRTLLNSVNPYDQAAFDGYIGRPWGELGHGYCSELGAIALGQRAFFHAQEIANTSGNSNLEVGGLGLTAAVSTDRTRRGDNKIHAMIRTVHLFQTVAVLIDRNQGRQVDGAISDIVGINLILHSAGIDQIPMRLEGAISSDELVDTGNGLILKPRDLTPPDISGHNQGTLLIGIDGKVSEPDLDPKRHIVIPGSFNPMQYGHDRMAQAVQDFLGLEPVLEISARNIEKSATSMSDLAIRALQMEGRWPVILTQSNTRFIDKARSYNGCSFAVGHDTAQRIVDPKYYGDDPAQVTAALQEFSRRGITFYVVSRRDQSEIAQGVQDLKVSAKFKHLFTELPGSFDISSTAIRTSVRPATSALSM